MPLKKKKLLEKIVKKDYKNELEKIMEEKNFNENAKSILLNILYKIDISYKDIEIVKKGIENKEEYLENLINIIKNNCNNIDIVKMNDEEKKIPENKTYIIDKKNKIIISYPIERKLLYAVSKIGKKEDIIKEKYFIINKTLRNLLNIGNNINFVEPIRDFNGYSWTTIAQEVESIDYNLIYQNLRILVGDKFLNKWIIKNEFMIDYFEQFKERLEKQFGKQNTFVNDLCKISILLEIKYNKEKERKILNESIGVFRKLEKIKDKEEFIREITLEKIHITKNIKKIDTIVNNKELLEKEYIKINEKLPLEKKIFSMKVLAKKMRKERQNYIKEIEKLNGMLNPKKFIKYEKKLKEEAEYLKILNERNQEEALEDIKCEIQKRFLNMLKIRIKKANTKQEIEKIIYDFRYYLLLPYDDNNIVGKVKELEELNKEVSQLIIEKSMQFKIFTEISSDKETNYEIIKNIFNIRIVKLENAYLKITKENVDGDFRYYVQILDENLFEEKVEIPNPKNLIVKQNKKVPIWY